MTKFQSIKALTGIVIVIIVTAWATLQIQDFFSSSEVGSVSHNTGPAFTFDDLLDAIEWVESKGEADAEGDWVQWFNRETAFFEGEYRGIGSFQIHKIYVDDVNRILRNRNKDRHEIALQYTYDDRYNKAKSREMVRLYLWNWAPDHRQSQLADGGIYIDGSDHTDMYYFGTCARIHNGGPNGHHKESTKAYWLKVKARMESAK